MYEKFGEFDSWEEINKAAQAQLEEGDLDAIKEIAKENGLDPEDVEDFCTGTIEELTTPTLAAIGKLDAEAVIAEKVMAEGAAEHKIRAVLRRGAELDGPPGMGDGPGQIVVPWVPVRRKVAQRQADGVFGHLRLPLFAAEGHISARRPPSCCPGFCRSSPGPGPPQRA